MVKLLLLITNIFYFINNLDSYSKRSKKYMMFDVNFKKKCVDEAKKYGMRLTSEKHNVPIKSLKRWISVGPERKKGNNNII
jgi:hypothetical protein